MWGPPSAARARGSGEDTPTWQLFTPAWHVPLWSASIVLLGSKHVCGYSWASTLLADTHIGSTAIRSWQRERPPAGKGKIKNVKFTGRKRKLLQELPIMSVAKHSRIHLDQPSCHRRSAISRAGVRLRVCKNAAEGLVVGRRRGQKAIQSVRALTIRHAAGCTAAGGTRRQRIPAGESQRSSLSASLPRSQNMHEDDDIQQSPAALVVYKKAATSHNRAATRTSNSHPALRHADKPQRRQVPRLELGRNRTCVACFAAGRPLDGMSDFVSLATFISTIQNPKAKFFAEGPFSLVL